MQEKLKKEYTSYLEDCLDVMYRVAVRMTKGDEAAAEDLVAEACLKAWKSYKKLKKKESFKPWIIRIMKNTYISKYRKWQRNPKPVPEADFARKHEDFSLFEQLSNPLFLNTSQPEKEFLTKITIESIHEAIDDLPEKYKDAVILFCLEGFSYKEISEILDIPVGTVRSRLARGRSMLQRELWEHISGKEEK